MLNLNAHQVLKDHIDKQFHDIHATEFFLQIEREVATEEMKEGSGQWDTWSWEDCRREKSMCALSCYLHVSGWYLGKQATTVFHLYRYLSHNTFSISPSWLEEENPLPA